MTLFEFNELKPGRTILDVETSEGVKRMINIIENYIQCDECGSHLSYDKEDTYIDYNWRHTHRIEYIDCPNCGNSVAIKEIKDK